MKRKEEIVWLKKNKIKENGKNKIKNKKLKQINATIIFSQYFHNKF